MRAERSPFLPGLGGQQCLYICLVLHGSPLPHVLPDEIVQDSFQSSHLGKSEVISSWVQSNCPRPSPHGLRQHLDPAADKQKPSLSGPAPAPDTKGGGAEGGAGRARGHRARVQGALGEDFLTRRCWSRDRLKCWVNGCSHTIWEKSVPGGGRGRSMAALRPESPCPGETAAEN